MNYEMKKETTSQKEVVSSFITHPSYSMVLPCRSLAPAIISGLLITLISTVNYQLGIVQRQETVTGGYLAGKKRPDRTGKETRK